MNLRPTSTPEHRAHGVAGATTRKGSQMATRQKEQATEQVQEQEGQEPTTTQEEAKEMEIATGETKSEQKAKSQSKKAKSQSKKGEAKKEQEPKKEQEKKEQAPSYPKWPEVPAAYTQTVKDKMVSVAVQMQEHSGLKSEVAGASNALGQLVGVLQEAEKPFAEAGAKAWITKEALSQAIQGALARVPDLELDKEYQGHPDLEILFRRGGDSALRQLAKAVCVEL